MTSTDITVTGKAFKPSDDAFHIYVNGKELHNYTSFAFNRSLEQLPGNFTITMALAGTNVPELLEACHANYKATFYVAKKLMFTGIIEHVEVNADPSQHGIVIQGRSALRDLFDCSSQINRYRIQYSGISDLASQLCSPFGVKTYMKSGTSAATSYQSTQLQTMNFNAGETPYAILQRAARVYGKILYDSVAGALVIADVASGSSVTTIDTSINQVESTAFSLDISQRMATYEVIGMPNDPYSSTAQIPAPRGIGTDPQPDLVGSERTLLIINSLDSPDHQFAQNIAQWQANRNYGRSMVMTLVMTGFLTDDFNQNLWDVNTLVTVTDRLTGIEGMTMIVAGYTMAQTEHQGSTTTLTLMPREAFSVEPAVINPTADYNTTPQ